MTNDKFDRELNSLYQQRQSQITPPNVCVSEKSSAPKRTPLQFIAVFVAGGFASFAIMAFISHLSSAPEPDMAIPLTHVEIDINDVVDDDEDQTVIVIKQPLPKPPTSTQPLAQESMIPSPVAPITPLLAEDIVISPATDTRLPTINLSAFKIEPVLKVMPKYPRNVTLKKVSSIQLRYTITTDGAVKDIVVVKSDVANTLEKATKKALLQWRYKPHATYPIQNEIIFEFEPNEP
ncbi:TonB family protein [Colwellia sp. RSH04]|uniref:TonB family protein n=1 Tax=Colwellia sp. RSH04 TaxID=2305464 RepID=UPI000E574649|nr:TonB family protein [Colwellia sp. RSH04]RHW75724.1 TonB family protein [Colwellia sp. RSH04]